ncbi:MAG: 6,7-dimethyl-8-ribityllumazine synthase [Candidatus Omnitrophica bacterium]|nr:6,7-dimethyl-8-ribityllumazine synthase [Candidatus Omnitrophota bacterium]
MPNVLEGKPQGKNRRVAVIASRFNNEVTVRLLEGCLRKLKVHGVSEKNIFVVWTPGAFEIPFAAQQVIRHLKPDGVVTLGAVIRGETAHFGCVCDGLVRGIVALELDSRVPISFGVLTVENDKQAWERSGGRRGNKGREAAEVVLRLMDLKRRMKS